MPYSDLPNTQGLTTLLRDGDVDLDRSRAGNGTAEPAGLDHRAAPAQPGELLGSHRMRAFLEHVESAVDLVVLDSPPLQVFADASILGSLVDGTVVVIDAGAKPVGATSGWVARRWPGPARNVLGAVLNRVAQQADTGYGYEYGGYYDSETAPAGAAPMSRRVARRPDVMATRYTERRCPAA